MSDRTICLVLAALTVGLMASNLPLLWLGLGGISTGQLGPMLALVFFALGIASVVGLARQSLWAFPSYYLLAVIGTFGFGLALVPFLPGLFPTDTRTIAVLLINAFVLSLAVTTHITLRRARQAEG